MLETERNLNINCVHVGSLERTFPTNFCKEWTKRHLQWWYQTEKTDLLQQLAKVLVVLRFKLRQTLQLDRHVKLLPVLLLGQVV